MITTDQYDTMIAMNEHLTGLAANSYIMVAKRRNVRDTYIMGVAYGTATIFDKSVALLVFSGFDATDTFRDGFKVAVSKVLPVLNQILRKATIDTILANLEA